MFCSLADLTRCTVLDYMGFVTITLMALAAIFIFFVSTLIILGDIKRKGL